MQHGTVQRGTAQHGMARGNTVRRITVPAVPPAWCGPPELAGGQPDILAERHLGLVAVSQLQRVPIPLPAHFGGLAGPPHLAPQPHRLPQ